MAYQKGKSSTEAFLRPRSKMLRREESSQPQARFGSDNRRGGVAEVVECVGVRWAQWRRSGDGRERGAGEVEAEVVVCKSRLTES